jgi:hypothetical protein
MFDRILDPEHIAKDKWLMSSVRQILKSMPSQKLKAAWV